MRRQKLTRVISGGLIKNKEKKVLSKVLQLMLNFKLKNK